MQREELRTLPTWKSVFIVEGRGQIRGLLHHGGQFCLRISNFFERRKLDEGASVQGALARFPRSRSVLAEWASCRKGSQIVQHHDHRLPLHLHHSTTPPVHAPCTSSLQLHSCPHLRVIVIFVSISDIAAGCCSSDLPQLTIAQTTHRPNTQTGPQHGRVSISNWHCQCMYSLFASFMALY